MECAMTSNTDQTAVRDVSLLADIRNRRAELRASMGVLELVLASPARGGRATGWAARLRAAVIELYDEFTLHLDIAEDPPGVYGELARQSSELAHMVAQIAREHAEIMRRIEELLTWTDALDERPDVPEARRLGTELLAALMRHRQRVADLVFEAYELDIEGAG
jgi:hypothetical protein